MSNIYHCHSCGKEVRRGEAKVRSISFEQVAYCLDCYERDHNPAIPEQRVSAEELLEQDA